MTKLKVLFLSLIFIQVQLFGQVEITEIGPAIGDEFYYGVFIDAPDPGDDGANVIWDFEDFNTTFYTLVNYVNTPSDLTGYEDYPDCSSGWIVDLIVSEPFNSFFDFENGAWIEYGSYADVFSIISQSIYTDPFERYSFPMNYGDSGSDTYAGTTSLDAISGTLSASYTYEVDAYGSISLPTSNFPVASYENALRVSYIQNESSIISGITTLTDIYGYQWFIDQYPVPIAISENTISLNISGDTLDNTNYFYRLYGYNGVVLGLEENQIDLSFNMYPNPCKDYISIDYDLNERAELQILSLDGKRVKSFSIAANTRLDVSDIHPGFYISKLFVNGQYILTSSFIKSN